MDYQVFAYVTHQSNTYKLSAKFSRGSENWEINGHLSQDGFDITFAMAASGPNLEPIDIEAVFTTDSLNNVHNATLKLQLQPYAKDVAVFVQAALPFKNIAVKIMIDGDRVFATEAGAENPSIDNLRATFLVFCPSLGLDKDYGVRLVFRAVSPSDFEFTAGLHATTSYEGSVKFQIGCHPDECNSLDAKVDLMWLTNHYWIKFGYKIDDESTEPFKAFINSPYFNVEVTNDATTVTKSLTAEVEGVGKLSVSFNYKVKDTMRASFSLHSDVYQIHRSSEVTIRYGSYDGQIEITYGGFPKHSMRLELHDGNTRIARAIVRSPLHGNYELSVSQSIKSGVLMFATGSGGMHKFSYKVDDDDHLSFTCRLESPLLSEGTANFELSLNSASNIYSSKMSFNNRHFLSWSFGCSEEKASMDASLSLQSPLLPTSPVEMALRVKYSKLEGNLFVKTVYQGLHTLEGHYSKLTSSAFVRVNSFLIPGKEGYVSVNLKNLQQINAQLRLGEDMLELKANASIIEYKAHHLTAILLHKGHEGQEHSRIELEYRLERNETSYAMTGLVISTLHPSVSYLKLALRLDDDIQNGERRKGQVSLQKAPNGLILQVAMNLPKVASRSDFANMTITSNEGNLYLLKTTWELDRSKLITAVLNGPTGQVMAASIRVKALSTLSLQVNSNMESSMPRNVAFKFEMDPRSSITGASAVISLKCDEKQMLVELQQTFSENHKYAHGKLFSTFGGEIRNYEVQIGYQNEDRKMAKAHFAYPGGQMGVKFEYFFVALTDFLIEAKVDLPIEAMSFSFFKIGHTLTESEHYFVIGAGMRGGAELLAESKLDLSQFSINHDLSTKLYSTMVTSNLHIDMLELSLEAKLYGSNEAGMIFNSGFRGASTQRGTEGELRFEMNNPDRKLLVERSLRTNSIVVEFRNILDEFAFSGTMHLDAELESWQVISEVVWDTTRPDSTTEKLSFGFRKAQQQSFEFNAGVTWPSNETDALSLAIDRSLGNLLSSVSVMHNSKKLFGMNVTCFSDQAFEVEVKVK